MSYSSSVSSLPTVNTYAAALRLWDRKAHTSRSVHWPPDRRPLHTLKAPHYCMRRSGDSIEFILYKTAVVTWHGHTTIDIDGDAMNSFSTRVFRRLYTPNEFSHKRLGEKDVIVYRHYDKEWLFPLKMLRFEQQPDGFWMCETMYAKPTRRVLDPAKYKEIEKKLKPFKQWVRDLFAICGNDGTHPWVNQDEDTYPRWNGDMGEGLLLASTSNDARMWEQVFRLCVPQGFGGKPMNFVYCPCSLHVFNLEFKKHVNKMYEALGCYIDLPYDQKVPRVR